MKKYMLYIVVINCLVAALLAWIGISRINDFRAYHYSIAQESATSVANGISHFITEKTRLVGLFANDHLQLIEKIVKHPDDDELHEQLRQRIAEYFPSYFSFTVTNKNGVPYIEDFDDLIRELCIVDLKSYAKTRSYRPRIHPHNLAYHFDVFAPFEIKAIEGILFVSFHADILASILKSSQTPGHQLMLVYPKADNLIEVTTNGARINWDRDDYRLSEEEKSRILYTVEVTNTLWQSTDLHQSALLTDFETKITRNSGIIFLLFAGISIAMLFFLRKEEQLRKIAEKHKDEFLSVVSHELRTPLTSINGSLNLMASGIAGKMSDKAVELTSIAVNNCERLIFLINDILDLQKIEAGRMAFDKKAVDLSALLRRCIVQNQGYAEKFHVYFELKKIADGIVVYADDNRISQVMANLLSNAAKYGAEQDHIEVSLEKYGDMARISVTDHGTGIPDEFRQRIFQKFAQFDATDQRKVGGTGLGMSIVKQIVENHDGNIHFDTATGSGTTFYVDLPMLGDTEISRDTNF